MAKPELIKVVFSCCLIYMYTKERSICTFSSSEKKINVHCGKYICS